MKRELVYQVVLAVMIGLVCYVIVASTNANLERLGVTTGIDFLWKRAGFEIGQTLIPYNADSTILRAFFVALINTLLLAVVSITLASILGLLIGVARLSSNWLLRSLATCYVELFRNIPSLLQIFFWYFVVLRSLPAGPDSLTFRNIFILNNRGFYFPAPADSTAYSWLILLVVLATLCIVLLKRQTMKYQDKTGKAFPFAAVCLAVLFIFIVGIAHLTGLAWEYPKPGRFSYSGGFVLLPEFLALVIGLSMYNATYIGEIVRSSFQAVPHGQQEAAESLGFSWFQILRMIIFPQALRIMIPPLTTVYQNIFKSTSLAAAIAYPELVSVFVGTVNNLVGQSIAIMLITMMVYVVISLCTALVMSRVNRGLPVANGVKH